MIILGINSVYHETAAALLVDGKIVAAAEEERFNRKKHGKPAYVSNPHHLPEQSIRFCLESSGVKPHEIDKIGYSFSMETRRKEFREDRLSESNDWGSSAGEEIFISCLEKVPEAVSNLLSYDVSDRFLWIPHHVAHAASCYYPAGTDLAAILVVDGIGEHATTLMAEGKGETIRCLKELEYPNSLGFLWEKLTKFLGFSEYDACKVMGLAGYGDPKRLTKAFESFIHVNSKGFEIDSDILKFRLDSYDQLEKHLGKSRRRDESVESHHADIAATLQNYNNRIVLSLAKELYELCPAKTLCFAGGVALNCSTNWVLKEQGPFENIYIPSAPHDAGTAIGAALYAYRKMINGETARDNNWTSPYLGPKFTDDEVLSAIEKKGLKSRYSENVAQDTAKFIAEGKVVGWFQDRMEFGPRALGNRSLLADPRDSSMRDRINRKIKRREDFRPFAPSVLEEDCEDWFEIGRTSTSYDHMLFACPVKEDKLSTIPAVIHIDNTARVQIVRKSQNPKYHSLISSFKEITGVSLVLNTSFNDSEPIVCSPADALATFMKTNIDTVVLGNYIVERGANGFDGRREEI